MSFSFSTDGKPKAVIAYVGKQAAVSDCPPELADAVNNQLAGLPENADVRLSVHGHAGWGQDQRTGQISLHATLDVTVPQPDA